MHGSVRMKTLHVVLYELNDINDRVASQRTGLLKPCFNQPDIRKLNHPLKLAFPQVTN